METEMRQYIQDEVLKTQSTLERIASDEEITALVEQIATRCSAALRAGKKILFAGNGGSAADAQHLAGELVSRLNFDRPGNDYGYERLFARQLNAVGAAGDVFFGISTSGRSPNILRALEEGRRKNLITVGLTGQISTDMQPLCDYCIAVPSTETPKIQEGHIILGHIICGLIEREMFGGD
jgi:D-sedoheptulose 7-phosphate isomerase